MTSDLFSLRFLKSKIIKLWKNITLSKSKLNISFDIAILLLFALVFFSIPACSFTVGLNKITWVLTIALFGLMGLSLILFYKISINFISLSFLLFALSSIISSLINGFANFILTPIYLIMCSFILYEYCVGTSKFNKMLLQSAYIGVVGFALLYCFKYRTELLTLNFDRLGSFFGDENDVAIFMAFGGCVSFFNTVNSKSIYIKLPSFLLFLVFSLCGISTGSKIFLLITLVCCCLVIFLHFGLKKIWMSILIIGLFIGLFFVVLKMPFASSIKTRLDSFFASFSKSGEVNGQTGDISTQERVNMFLCGFQMFLKKPLFGYGVWGFGNFGNFNNGWSHNHFSETLCNFGIVGTFFFHFGLMSALIYYFKNKKINKNQLPFLICVLFFCMMFSVALNSQKIYAYLVPICIASLLPENSLSFNFGLKHEKNKIS